MRAACLLLAGALGAAGVQAAQPGKPGGGLQGTVTAVIDGDSVVVTPARGGKPLEVQLAGIDAPEACQEHGAEAKKFLTELVLNQAVRLVPGGDGPSNGVQGRMLGTLYLGDVEVNRRLVEEGQAWSIRIKWDQGPFVTQERMAKALSRGVHRVGSAAVTPKDFRQRHGPCK